MCTRACLCTVCAAAATCMCEMAGLVFCRSNFMQWRKNFFAKVKLLVMNKSPAYV